MCYNRVNLNYRGEKMTIGEKIRQARLSTGLSQRQLCGERVTRNMLSQIENGSARPSMDTLSFFASRLGRPVSYFLDEDTVTSPNQALMATAREAFAARDYTSVLTVLKDYREPDTVFDAEKGLLKNLSLLSAAQQALDRAQAPLAHQLLEQIDENNLYYTATARREHHFVMGTLPPADDRELLFRAERALADGNAPRALEYLSAAEDHENGRWNLLCGKSHFAQNDYKKAIPCYQKAEGAYPKESLTALELCFRELGDFQNAYFYACKVREL